MDLYLRKVAHDQADHNYRVLWKSEDGEIEIGSIGIRHFTGTDSRWCWGIDTAIPMRDFEAKGEGADRADCMRRFKAAWTKFAADQASLTEFLTMKLKRR